jgi:hypothetical protein
MDELDPSIMRAIEERFGGRRPRNPEPRLKADQTAAPRVTQATMLPREQEGGEWRVVERRPRKKRAARKEEKKEGTPFAPSSRLTGTRKTGAAQRTFGPHFELLVPRVTTAANALRGLLPNSGGVGSGVR